MGDPKFSTRKYATPSHPWDGERILRENDLINKYGLKNKKELWKTEFMLGNFRQQARSLLARTRMGEKQAVLEKKLLLEKLTRLGLIGDNADITDILAIDIEAILNRRLQSVVYMKGLANTQKQARQFITHGHISIGGRKVTVPGYLVPKVKESDIDYNRFSGLSDDMHPARPREEYDVPQVQPSPQEPEAPQEGAAPAPEAPAEGAEQPAAEAKPAEGQPAENKSAEVKPEEKPAAVPAEKPAEPAKAPPEEKNEGGEE